MKQDETPLSMLAIYDCPRDYPRHLVVRCWTCAPDGTLKPGRHVLTFDTDELGHRGAVSAARAYCKRLGLTFVPRTKADDPVLIETWQGRLTATQTAQMELQAGRPAFAQ